eukprot:CAMPEP_0197311202 /NCGR_PEP_ID=MMETSP0891-20130614/9700_1 /TAXON_ID=44058 ORGANISM="Aureoumbra lagunensis, Strain CCMP1510" /NCGR_SAMPLE_ID=MMETSP0891 /ASSEMBLY_ACC=CAM_ASM_000534 /LENGTH=593 /DNA_ID=CAMNT_0042797189 /DNA_START=441 /DNA_END=2222 /DNA_ORIENTATION=+
MAAVLMSIIAGVCIFCAPRGGKSTDQEEDDGEMPAFHTNSPRLWEPTGQVRVSVLIQAGTTAEELFRLITGKREGEWSVDYEDKRVVHSLDPHTDIIEILECTPWSCRPFRKILAYNARYERRMRYWKLDDDGGYSIVSQSVDTNWSLDKFHVYKKICGIVASVTKGHAIEIRPINEGKRGFVVTEALEIDAKLSPISALFCEAPPSWCLISPTSILAIHWNAARLRDRLRGLRACAAQLCDEDPLHMCSINDKTKLLKLQLSGVIESPAHADIPYIITPKIVASPATSAIKNIDAKKKNISTETPAMRNDKIRKFKRSPSVNLLLPNTWDESPFSQFQVRGLNYLEDGRKIPAKPTAADLIALDALRTETGYSLIDVGKKLVPTIEGLAPDDRLVLVNFMLPYETKNAPHVSLLFFYRIKRNVDPAFLKRLDDFCAATDKVRDETFKLIPFIQDGPWIAKHALGQKPALVGRGITTHYFLGPNFIEIDIDVGSSSVANGIWRIMKGAGKLLVTDIAFLFESKTKEQLPETLLGTARISHFEISNAANPAFTNLSKEFFEEDSPTQDLINNGLPTKNSQTTLPPAYPTTKSTC